MPPYPLSPPTSRADLPTGGPGAIASAIQRGVAFIIDLFLVGLLVYYVLLRSDVHTKGKTVTIHLPLAHAIIAWAVPVLYSALCVMLKGTTIGGAAMGIKVVRYVDGGPVAPYQSFIRALVPAVPSLVASAVPGTVGSVVGLIQFVVYFSIFFDPILRGLHDKASGTIVLRTR